MSESIFRPPDLASETIAQAYARSQRERIARISEATSPKTTSKSVVPIGILGGGLMGTAIAATLLRAGRNIWLYDISEAVLAQAHEKIAAELAQQTAEDAWARQSSDLVRKKTHLTSRLAEGNSCEILIESIPEKPKLKQKLYRQLEDIKFGGFLFSNTSTIQIGRLAEPLSRKERFCGLHFFHPVRKRSLVEIIRGPETGEETIAAALRLAREIDKIPIVVGDGPGFLVNRLLSPFLNESLALLEEGVPLANIEEAALRFGMPMGPFRIMDEIGLDVALHAGWVLGKVFPERAVVSRILPELIARRRLGRKTGCGFLRYASETSWEKEGTPDPESDALIASFQASTASLQLSWEEIATRLVLPMFLEAIRAVEDGIITDFRDADVAVCLGLGFPVNRGGLCFLADAIGLDRIVQMLPPLEQRFGARFAPPKTLLEYANAGKSLIKT